MSFYAPGVFGAESNFPSRPSICGNPRSLTGLVLPMRIDIRVGCLQEAPQRSATVPSRASICSAAVAVVLRTVPQIGSDYRDEQPPSQAAPQPEAAGCQCQSRYRSTQ